jgi:hypothetical protein
MDQGRAGPQILRQSGMHLRRLLPTGVVVSFLKVSRFHRAEPPMVKAQAKGFFWVRYLVDYLGQESVLALSSWCQRATYALSGELFNFGREGFLVGPYLLQSPSGTLALARRRWGTWRERIDLEYAGRVYRLSSPALLGFICDVHEGELRRGAIYRNGLLARRVTGELPEDWPLPVQVFTIFLALVIWRCAPAGRR